MIANRLAGVAAALLCVVTTMWSYCSEASVTLAAEEAFVLQLDGVDYPMSIGTLVTSDNGSITLVSPNRLQQCQRPGGAGAVASDWRLIYDSVGRSLPLDGPLMTFDAQVLRLRSSTGDFRCTGGTPSMLIFKDTFE